MNRAVPIAILGAAGRMGMALIRCSRNMPSVQVVGALEPAGHAAIGTDAGLPAGIGAVGVPVTATPEGMEKADAVIDFTFHEAVPANVRAAAGLGKGYVLGTTGLSDDETAAVQAAAEVVPVVWAPNMSLGINLLSALVRQAAAALGENYDVEVVEMHHRHKQDAPSGTALHLARHVAAGRGQDLDRVADYGRHGMTGEREAGRIAIHAVRGGDVVGDHTVVFAGDAERIELTHRASSRDVFAMGALKAAAWVAAQPPGLYDMSHVLGLSTPDTA